MTTSTNLGTCHTPPMELMTSGISRPGRSSNKQELAKPLQYQLSNIMWKYCGVVKDKVSLESGLNKIHELKHRAKEIDVHINYNNCADLILSFDLEASFISAEATIISAIQRKESRGAHQRSDYPQSNSSENCNYRVKLNSDSMKLDIERTELLALRSDLHDIVSKVDQVSNFKGKLIE